MKKPMGHSLPSEQLHMEKCRNFVVDEFNIMLKIPDKIKLFIEVSSYETKTLIQKYFLTKPHMSQLLAPLHFMQPLLAKITAIILLQSCVMRLENTVQVI